MNVVWLAGGFIAVVLALGPPLHHAAEELFSAHMVQHLVLITVAAPLLALGLPSAHAVLARLPPARNTVRRGLRAAGRRIPFGATRNAGTAAAWLLHVVILWAWHTPALYEAAVRAPALHAVEHASLLISAVAFWVVVLRRRPRPLSAAVYLFAAAAQSTALGALLTLAAQPSYPSHADTAARWGLTPLADQQLAGVIMWVLGGLGYLGTALAVLARVVRDDRRPDQAMRPAAPAVHRRKTS